MNTPVKSTLVDMPIDPAQWAKWLESHLVGLDLGPLVAELAQVSEPSDASAPMLPPLDEVLGDDLDTVLRDGLSGLAQQKLNVLLRRPALLLALQERIVIDGGSYWQTVSRSQHRQTQAKRGWEALQSAMQADDAATDQSIREVGPVEIRREREPAERRKPAPMFVWSGIAALLLAAIGIIWWAQSPTGVGFDRAGLMTAKVDAKTHLNALADAAADYAIPAAADKSTLRKQIVSFRHGCDTLQNAAHEQLPVADRDWLKERCKAWSDKLDGFLAALDGEKESLEAIRNGVEETRTKMITALRGRIAA
jgi:hypothetical protein